MFSALETMLKSAFDKHTETPITIVRLDDSIMTSFILVQSGQMKVHTVGITPVLDPVYGDLAFEVRLMAADGECGQMVRHATVPRAIKQCLAYFDMCK